MEKNEEIKKEKDTKLVMGKTFQLNTVGGGILKCIAFNLDEVFGAPNIVLVSEDGETWVTHKKDELLAAIEKQLPIRTK